MKKYTLILFICFFALPTFAQSAYQLIQSYNIIRSTAKIKETIEVPQTLINVALEKAYFQSLYKSSQEIQMIPLESSTENYVQVAYYFTQEKCKPTEVYGGYNYLKLYCSMMDPRTLKTIRKTDKYNGIHHIVNQSTIKLLYYRYIKTNPELSQTVKLQDMLVNAPAILHPLHNEKAYTEVFHNYELQIQIYVKYGVEGIIVNFFNQINEINRINKLPEIDADIIRGTLIQGELWAKTYGLKWSVDD